jgi:hypothetical protein
MAANEYVPFSSDTVVIEIGPLKVTVAPGTLDCSPEELVTNTVPTRVTLPVSVCCPDADRSGAIVTIKIITDLCILGTLQSVKGMEKGKELAKEARPIPQVQVPLDESVRGQNEAEVEHSGLR